MVGGDANKIGIQVADADPELRVGLRRSPTK